MDTWSRYICSISVLILIYLLVEGAWQVIEQMWLLPPYQGEQVLLCQSVPGTANNKMIQKINFYVFLT